MKKAFAILLAACLLTVLMACASREAQQAPTDVKSDSLAQTPSLPNEDEGEHALTLPNGELLGATDVSWQAVPTVSKKQLDLGYTGGEGCQWPLYITYAYSDGNIAYFSTDVGGIYRSDDSGKTWQPCNVGIYCNGASGIAVDPTNADRVILIGGCGTDGTTGLYMSVNSGKTFELRVDKYLSGYRDTRQQVAYDKSSYDSSINGCKIIYWSRDTKKHESGKELDLSPALYKSCDGGKTWDIINTDANISGAQLHCNPDNGAIYAANSNGTFRSTDGGKSFDKILDGECISIDVIITKPSNVYITKREGLFVSTDGGDTFNKVSGFGYPTDYPAHFRVSPANPNNMVLINDMLTGYSQWSCDAYYSNDGGATWARAKRDMSGSFIGYGPRQGNFAWHPTEGGTCLSLGGDFIMKSTDSGATFKMSNDGYTGGCWTQFSFNVNNPDLIAVSNQDYCGAFSTDGGATWTRAAFDSYYQISGGYAYGAYMVDETTLLLIVKDTQNMFKLGKNKLVIVRSDNGGKTYSSMGVAISGGCVTGALGDENIVFAGSYRSEDKGLTWTKMVDCTDVRSYDLQTGDLYGKNGPYIVKSVDKGVTWQKLGDAKHDNIKDIAFDNTEKSVWALLADGTILRQYSNGSSSIITSLGDMEIKVTPRSIATDPKNGDVVYIACGVDVRKSKYGVLRSLDGGKTWQNTTKTPDNGVQGLEGGVEAKFIRTNPVTGELYSIGGCRGMWKIKSPVE